jgi:hypothetical protein
VLLLVIGILELFSAQDGRILGRILIAVGLATFFPSLHLPDRNRAVRVEGKLEAEVNAVSYTHYLCHSTFSTSAFAVLGACLLRDVDEDI